MILLGLRTMIFSQTLGRRDLSVCFFAERLLQQSYFPKHKFTEKEEIHEMTVPKLLGYMLYEIAKGED